MMEIIHIYISFFVPTIHGNYLYPGFNFIIEDNMILGNPTICPEGIPLRLNVNRKRKYVSITLESRLSQIVS